jgi:RNA polymerase sigma-54 factor
MRGRLDLIAKQDVVAICAECDIDAVDATDMLEDIRGLNPAPMRQTPEIAEVQPAPELIIKQTPTGDLKAELNEAALPRVLTDDALFSSTMAAETDGHAQMYYRDCYRGAGNMVRAMQKRANTLLATGSNIAKQQKKFIRTGRDRDKLPLTIEQLASQVGVHKSTVSRALKSCSIMTDRGTYQAHEFLARALTSEGHHNKTRDQALRRLALLVKTENPRQPNSDEQLAQQLDNLNFAISRRTVAKYRKLLDIPGMHSRRKP